MLMFQSINSEFKEIILHNLSNKKQKKQQLKKNKNINLPLDCITLQNIRNEGNDIFQKSHDVGTKSLFHTKQIV